MTPATWPMIDNPLVIHNCTSPPRIHASGKLRRTWPPAEQGTSLGLASWFDIQYFDSIGVLIFSV
jgi:hypothetical protein